MATKKLQILDYTIKQAENANTLGGKSAEEFALVSDVEELQSQLEDADAANKAYVDDKVSKIELAKIVTELPEVGESNKTYFVTKEESEDNNIYDEYMWINDAWEYIGTKQIEIDLTDYVKKNDYAARNTRGIVWFDAYSYMQFNDAATGLRLVPASNALIKDKPYGSHYAPITCGNYEYAVKTAMTNSSEWTDEEIAAAQNKLGLGDIDAALDELHTYAQLLVSGGATE